MTKLIALILAVATLLTVAPMAEAEEPDTIELMALITEWRACDHDVMYIAIDEDGTERIFYGDPDEYRIGDMVSLLLWIPDDFEVLDVIVQYHMDAEDMAHWMMKGTNED